MKAEKILKSTDFYVGLAILASFMIMIWQILGISVTESRIFPSIATAITGISGISLIIKTIRNPDEDAKHLIISIKELLALVILIIGYFLYSLIGFYTTLFFVVTGIALVIKFPISRKSILFSLAYGLIVTAVCFICFYLILGLYTPVGMFI